MRALAENDERAVLEENQRRIDDFRARREALAGFSPDSIDGDQSVRALLRARMGDVPVAGLEKGAEATEGETKDWSNVLDLVLKSQWELFYWTDAVAEKERRSAVAKGEDEPEVETRLSYLPIVRTNPQDPRVRSVDVRWREAYSRDLSDAQRSDLERRRRGRFE